MKLSTKITICFLVLFGSGIVLLFFSGHYFIKRGFTAAEESSARINATRLQQAVGALNNRVKMLTQDWACWDDAYAFILDRNNSFVKANIQSTTFVNSGLDSIVFLDSEGILVEGYSFDPETEKVGPIHPPLAEYLGTHHDRFKLEPGQSVTGLIAIPKATLLTAACPLLSSKGEGPVRGTLVMTSALNNKSFATVTKILLMDATIYSIHEAGRPYDIVFPPPYNSRPIGENVYIREAGNNTLIVTTSLNDMDGRPSIVLNLKSPRPFVQQQALAMHTLTISLLIMTLVFGTVSLAALHMLVTVRVAKLHEQIVQIKQHDRLDTPIPPVPELGRDEIGALGRAFNEMIGALTKSRHELEKSDEYKKILINSLHMGVVVIDATTHRILEANDFALSMIGRPWGSVNGAVCQHMICPTIDGKCPISDLRQNMDLTESVLLTADGQQLPILKSVIPIVHNGRRLHIESFVDISKQKEVEQNLLTRMEIESTLATVSVDMASASSINLDSVIQATLQKIGALTGTDRIGVYIISPDQQFISNTHEWCKPGIDSEIDQLQHMKLEDYPVWLQTLWAQKYLLVSDTKTTSAEGKNERQLLLSKGVRTFLAIPLLNGNQPIGCIGFSSKNQPKAWGNEDIGLLNMLGGIIASALNRKAAEEAIRQSAEQYQAIFDNSGASIIVDRENIINLANREFLFLVGLPKNKVIHTAWTQFVHPDDLQKVGDKLAAVFEGKSSHAILTLKMKTHHFTTTCTQTSIAALPGSKQWIISFMDVTDREQAERHLQEANRIKSEFLANISHEVRTPLNSIIGYTEIIKDGSRDESTRKYSEIILRASEDLLTMFQEILDAARLDAGKMVLRHNAFALHALLDSIENTASLLTRPKKLAFSIEKDPAIPDFLVGDETRLRQVLTNLVINAIKFTGKGGVSLRIETASAHPLVIRYSVIDTGIGIPQEKQAVIFESFAQADGGISRKYGGTGLGITIAQKLVNLMGGQIQLKSEPGHGSTFWFEIPQHAAQTLPVEIEDEETAPATTHARVLVAEDSLEIQAMVKIHLDQSGCETYSASNGLEALQRCEEHTFDLILMDLQMPEMDGIEAVRCIRAGPTANRYTPIVGITAFAGLDVKERCTKAGFNDIMVKPFRKKDFFKTMERWLLKTAPEKPLGEDGPEVDLQAAEAQDNPTQEAAPFLYSQALYEFGGNKSMLQSVVKQFVASAPDQLSAMQEALAKNDLETIRRHAHKISGSAGNLTAYAMAKTAKAIEQFVLGNEPAPLAEALEALAEEYRRLKDFVLNVEELGIH